eukprot:8874908-Heterocapsa_arctica.AAC.1
MIKGKLAQKREPASAGAAAGSGGRPVQASSVQTNTRYTGSPHVLLRAGPSHLPSEPPLHWTPNLARRIAVSNASYFTACCPAERATKG